MPMTRPQMTVLQSNSGETFWMRFSLVGGHALRRRIVKLRHQRGPSWEEVAVQERRCGNRKLRLERSEQDRMLLDLQCVLDCWGVETQATDIYVLHSWFILAGLH
jgi:hypothetical protein